MHVTSTTQEHTMISVALRATRSAWVVWEPVSFLVGACQNLPKCVYIFLYAFR